MDRPTDTSVLTRTDAERWFIGAILLAGTRNIDDAMVAFQRLPTTMTELWDVAYRRVDLADQARREAHAFRALTPIDRMLATTCYALAVVCAEADLRAVVDALATPRVAGLRDVGLAKVAALLESVLAHPSS